MARDLIAAQLEELRSQGLYRCLRQVEGEQGPVIRLEGREVLNLSSNNYLGLANHPVLGAAAKVLGGAAKVLGGAAKVLGDAAKVLGDAAKVLGDAAKV
ncbi:MAG: hypothetical protein QF619_04100, partial [Candidatus Binatia bacterium]|nr:hypothetical protein [Candidatus Binatia bacterium]